MEKVTFIIPCYNEVHLTKKCVNSIRKNSPYGSFNFVFVDNGSTDGTSEFLKTIPEGIVIRNEKNIYVNPAWNQAFKYVLEHDLGKYVCLCNNDIEAGEKWLEPIFDLFSQGRNEWYLPTSNTQDEPAFHNDFKEYCDKLKHMPLKLTYINKNFIGFCMFFRKDHIPGFYPVPESLKILRGDDWITDCITHQGAICLRVSHCACHHFNGGTQRGMQIHELRDNDCREFDLIVDTEYKKRKMYRIFDYKFSAKLL